MNQARLAATAAAFLLAACSKDATPGSPQTAAIVGVSTAEAGTPASPGKAKPANPNPRGLPSNALRVQMVEIIDRNGFEQPMPAASGFVPVGWKTQGGIQWGQQFMCTNGYNVDWVADLPGWHSDDRRAAAATMGIQ